MSSFEHDKMILSPDMHYLEENHPTCTASFNDPKKHQNLVSSSKFFVALDRLAQAQKLERWWGLTVTSV
jgi:hypothetical protein